MRNSKDGKDEKMNSKDGKRCFEPLLSCKCFVVSVYSLSDGLVSRRNLFFKAKRPCWEIKKASFETLAENVIISFCRTVYLFLSRQPII